jgi:hypothetical protein
MLMRCLMMLTLALFAQACAHKGAVKVDCDGPLRPINQPTSSPQSPVSVEPPKHESTDPSE